MNSFTDFTLNEEYKRIQRLGDRLAELESLIEWESFRPILSNLYESNDEIGGRPNTDEILLLKMLVLQSFYGLSDPEMERQANDRISFRKFLGFPEKIPDHSTLWYFRERLIRAGKEKAVWDQLQQQLDTKGLRIKKGVIQDASFITSDPGHASSDTPRGEEAKTRRRRDGTWAKKGKKSYFGYKLHILVDKEHQFIRRLKTTPASLHDSRVDLSRKGETVYRDKGYFGVKPQASMDKTMHRSTRGHPLSMKEERRNRAIMRVRALVERPFAVIKRVYDGAHALVTTCARVHVKMLFCCFSYNLPQLLTIHGSSS
ncbi:MAG: IS5 family transposase [Methanomicrobiales archaeon]|nr:IS5 family transposase [Methanomicrobiales archaeon]